MPSRRQFLRATPVAGTALLAGCSISLGSDDPTGYPASIPAPAAVPRSGFERTDRYDLRAVRDHPELRHPECRGDAVRCTTFVNDVVAQGEFVVGIDEVDVVAAAGATELNSYRGSLASPIGRYLFKIYAYTADSSSVEAALAERFERRSPVGEFDVYAGTEPGIADGSVVADDGRRLVVAPEGVADVVLERIAGDHRSFASTDADREVARDRLGSPSLEIVVSHEPASSAEAWADRSTAEGRTVELGGGSATYRTVHVFPSADGPAEIADDAVRSWAIDRFQPVASSADVSAADVTIRRDGRTLVCSVDAPRYVGLR